MWILFALTSAIILASRKIQEKQLVGEIGQSLGWMIRLGSAVVTIILWAIFSRDPSGLFHPTVVYVLLYCAVAYPLLMYLYYRSMHELPLSVFGMLAPIAPITAFFTSWILFDVDLSIGGIIGILAISLGIIALFYKNTHSSIRIRSILMAISTYMIMGFGGVMDKVALTYTDIYTYASANQLIAAITVFLSAHFIFGDTKIHLFRKYFNTVVLIGLIQGIGWTCGIYAYTLVNNAGYVTALINTHAILTALYGVFILKEEITKRKVFVFICMLVALVSFAFA